MRWSGRLPQLRSDRLPTAAGRGLMLAQKRYY